MPSGGSNKLAQERVIEQFKEVHGDEFDYSKVVYINTHTPIEVRCKKHDFIFHPTPKNHKKGHRCSKCGEEGRLKLQTKLKETYINQVKTIHSNLYTYDKVDYRGCRKTIVVTCKTHGDFNIQANNHLHNHGCPECSNEMKKNSCWKDSDWVNAGNKSKNFIAFQVYLIKCSSIETNELFYKIGKTFKEIKNRFSNKNLPYSYEILKVIEGGGVEISILERELHKKYKDFRYKPIEKFGGSYECYNLDLPIEEIINLNNN